MMIIAAVQFAKTSDSFSSWWIELLLAIFSSISGALTTLTANLKYEKLSQKHKNASESYEILVDKIVIYRLKPRQEKNKLYKFVENQLIDYQHVRKSSPIIFFDDEIEEISKSLSAKKRSSSHSDVELENK